MLSKLAKNNLSWLIPIYVDLFAGANKVGGKGYAYIFDHVPAGWKKDGAVAIHAIEVPYIFGDWVTKAVFGQICSI